MFFKKNKKKHWKLSKWKNYKYDKTLFTFTSTNTTKPSFKGSNYLVVKKIHKKRFVLNRFFNLSRTYFGLKTIRLIGNFLFSKSLLFKKQPQSWKIHKANTSNLFKVNGRFYKKTHSIRRVRKFFKNNFTIKNKLLYPNHKVLELKKPFTPFLVINPNEVKSLFNIRKVYLNDHLDFLKQNDLNLRFYSFFSNKIISKPYTLFDSLSSFKHSSFIRLRGRSFVNKSFRKKIDKYNSFTNRSFLSNTKYFLKNLINTSGINSSKLPINFLYFQNKPKLNPRGYNVFKNHTSNQLHLQNKIVNNYKLSTRFLNKSSLFVKKLNCLFLSGNTLPRFNLLLSAKTGLLLESKHGFFTFHHLSIFLINSLRNTYTSELNNKFIFRKSLFSFIYPNQIRNYLFFKKKKTLYNKLTFNNKFMSKNLSINLLKYKSYHSNLYFKNIIFNKYTKSAFEPSNLYLIQKNYQNLYFKDVNLSRIKFKPGYQRIWRRVRSALKEFLGLNFVYQKQLTLYLSRFYKLTKNYTLSLTEMSLNKIILYSQLLPDTSSTNLFFSKKFLYLNQRVVTDMGILLQPGDFIQLLVSLNYYILFRWLNSLSKNRSQKFKYLVFRKGKPRRYKIMKLKKQFSYRTPSWVYKNRYDFLDIKSFLEVDYFTLSCFVIHFPFSKSYYSPDHNFDMRINTLRLYNWKYIT